MKKGDSGAVSKKQVVDLDIQVPENVNDIVVPDSISVQLSSTAQMLGNDLVSNLDRLLRTPSGCGEQNMLGLTPNVAAVLCNRYTCFLHYLGG